MGAKTRAIHKQLKGVEVLEVEEEKVVISNSLNGDLLEEDFTAP